MYCKNCGKEIDDQAVVCVYCGVATGNAKKETSTNVIGLVGFILAFFFPLVGLVLSIIGYRRADKYDNGYKGLSLAGIIISTITLVIGAILIIIMIIGFIAAMSAVTSMAVL